MNTALPENTEDLLLSARRAGIKLSAGSGALLSEMPPGHSDTAITQGLERHSGELVSYFEELRAAFLPSPPQTGLAIQQQRQAATLNLLSKGRLNGFFAFLIRGPLQVEALQEALTTLVQRHGVLRTRYVLSEDGTLAATVGDTALPILHLEKRKLSHSLAKDSSLLALASEWATRDIELDSPCLLRSFLMRGSDEHILVVSVPHFVSDAHACRILLYELPRYYRRCEERNNAERFPVSSNYDQYIRSQGEAMMSGKWLEGRKSWRDKYREIEGINVPAEYSGTQQDNSHASRNLFELSGSDLSTLTAIAREARCSPDYAFIAITSIALAKWSRQRKYLMPTIYRGRKNAEELGIVGMFLTALGYPVDFGTDLTFKDTLAMTVQNWMRLVSEGGIPNSLAYRDIIGGRRRSVVLTTNFILDLGKRPAVRQVVDADSTSKPEVAFSDLELPRQSNNPHAVVDIHILVHGNSDGVTGVLSHKHAIINPEGAEALCTAFGSTISDAIQSNGTNRVF